MIGLIAGEKVRLSGIRHDDIPAFLKWSEDEDFMRHLRIGPIVADTEQDLREWIDSSHKSNSTYGFVVRPREDETLVGFVNLMNIEWTHGSVTLAIAIAPGHQGKGYGREAMELALRFAFHEFNLYRVQLFVFSYNMRAVGLYESLGFVQEGVLRGAIHRDGRRYDTLVYGILRDEWAAARKDALPPALGT